MSPEQVTDIARQSVWVMLVIGAPTMLVALGVGVVVSLLQALTQIQEATLSFVPKLAAILLTFVLTAPFILATLRDFTQELFNLVVAAPAGGPG